MKAKYAFLLSSILLGLVLLSGVYQVAHDYWTYGFSYERTIIIEGKETIETVYLSTSIFVDFVLVMLLALQLHGFLVSDELEWKSRQTG